MYGAVSGVETGYVTNPSTFLYVSQSNTILQDVVSTTYVRAGGDSGAPVTEAFSGDPGFVGIHVAGSSNNAYFVKHNQFTNNFSGLSWGL